MLTYPKVREFVVMIGPRGGGLSFWLVVDELSTRVDAIILPLLFLTQFWNMGEIEIVKGWDLILKFGQGLPCFGTWLP